MRSVIDRQVATISNEAVIALRNAVLVEAKSQVGRWKDDPESYNANVVGAMQREALRTIVRPLLDNLEGYFERSLKSHSKLSLRSRTN